eukprot:15362546-Ditylum_brightwellii.AAC.1
MYGPNAQTVCPSDYYIKPVAVWIPYLLIPGYIPHCPRCKKTDQVSISGAEWINQPMMLHTLIDHKLLDTKRVPCKRCKHRFRCTNQTTMALDTSGAVQCIFRIYMGTKLAVDEGLHHFITSQMTEPVQTTERLLRSMTFQKYVGDIIEFMLKMKMKLARVERKNNRSLIVGYCSSRTKSSVSTALNKSNREQIVTINKLIQRLRWKLESAQSQRVEEVTNFDTLLKNKKRKRGKTSLRSLGIEKLKKLLDSGIRSDKELIDLFELYSQSQHSSNTNAPQKILNLFSKLSKQNNPGGIVKGWVCGIKAELNSRKQEKISAISSLVSELKALEDERDMLREQNEDEVSLENDLSVVDESE